MESAAFRVEIKVEVKPVAKTALTIIARCQPILCCGFYAAKNASGESLLGEITCIAVCYFSLSPG